MEVTQRFAGIGLVATLLIALSSAQIIVQPGYSPPGYHGFSGSPMSQRPDSNVQKAAHRASPKSLNDEIQRNVALHRELENHILQMSQAQQAQPMPPEMVALPFVRHHPSLSGGQILSWGPSGLRGLQMRTYGLFRSSPGNYQDAYRPQIGAHYAGRSHRPRSVLGGPNAEPNADVGKVSKVLDVASKSPVEGDTVHGVDDLPTPEALATDNSTDKLVEPRHVSKSDDGIVGSPLDKIHYDQPRNLEQHHPLDASSVSSQIKETADAIGQIIDTVVPGERDPRPDQNNKDPISSMTRHQDPQGNYDQDNQDSRKKNSNNWSAPIVGSTNQALSGAARNGQQLLKSGLSSVIPAVQNLANPRTWVPGYDQYLQKAANPVVNLANYWQSQGRQGYGVQPNYPNYYPANYGTSGYQPQSQYSQPNVNGQPSKSNNRGLYRNGPSSATATASAGSLPNNYGGFHPSGQFASATASASSSASNYFGYPAGNNPQPQSGQGYPKPPQSGGTPPYANGPPTDGGSPPNVPTPYGYSLPNGPTPYGYSLPNRPTPYGQPHPNGPSSYGQSHPNVPIPYGDSRPNVPTPYGHSRPNRPSSYGHSHPNVPTSYGHSRPNRPFSAHHSDNYDPYRGSYRDSYASPYASAINQFGRAAVDQFGRAAFDQFGRAAVDQFGRAMMSRAPSVVSSFVTNPNNMDYVKRIAGQQLPQIFKQVYGY